MLYDPKWQKTETKSDPFSLESLIAWLEKQPANASYCYLSNGECLLAHYFSEAGFRNVRMWTDGFWHGPRKCPSNVGQDEAIVRGTITRLPKGFNRIAEDWGHTYGDALRRARSALAAR